MITKHGCPFHTKSAGIVISPRGIYNSIIYISCKNINNQTDEKKSRCFIYLFLYVQKKLKNNIYCKWKIKQK